MKRILWLLLFTTQIVIAQKLKRSDKVILSGLQSHITYLAGDQLEGRRTGSNGEKMAYEYIVHEFEKTGLLAKGNEGSFLQAFEVNDGRTVNPASYLMINGNDLKIDQDYFPFSFSPNTIFETTASVALQESGAPWFFDLKELIDANKNNPHFDLLDEIKTKTATAAKKGATAFIVYNTSAAGDELKYDPKSKTTQSAIAVIYITNTAKEKYLNDVTALLDIRFKNDISEKKRTGYNVIGYIDNGAANTIIIGAHYDHLGYGEDHNSLFTGTVPEIHNGADDNASGTAAIIEMAKIIKASKLRHNNYLFISFSGEELGLYGSKYFTDHPTIDLSAANYMLNLDMVGRLNDSTHGLNIGGYGTSPLWGEALPTNDKFFSIKFDSSGTGPSDHTSFYRKDIPVLFFFTGIHSDYHKPSDDADKINYTGELRVIKYIYRLIEEVDNKGKLVFTKTRETAMSSKNNFKVTLGIMPDYTFGGTGVRADGISEGRPAQKAGLKPGDIIIQLGDHKCEDIQAYMGALGKFKKGDATKVKVKRGNEELVFDIVF